MSARLAVLAALLAAGPAHAEALITVVQPGGGFLAADGLSTLILHVVVRDERGPLAIERAEVRASIGRVKGTKILAAGRVEFAYTPPADGRAANDMLDLNLVLQDGDQRLEAFPIAIPAPVEPGLSLQLDATRMDATAPRTVELVAQSRPEVTAIELASSHGALESAPIGVAPAGKLRASRLRPPENLPPDAPSHITLIAVATAPQGFSGRTEGISIVAPIKLRAQIDPGAELLLEGAEDPVAPVTAAADGYTSIGAVVRFGAAIRAFAQRGKKKQEVPIVVPSGLVAPGLAVPIPGQDVADGGSGPTALVAIAPSPFGGGLSWPDLEVEGAKLIDMVQVSEGLRALNLERPRRRGMVSVLADGVLVGSFELGPAHATALAIEPGIPDVGERGAILARLTDAEGAPSDRPVPVARTAAGLSLPVVREAAGRYRVALPSSVPGDTGTEVEVVVELPPPPVLAGDAIELVDARAKLKLEGPAPAIQGAADAPVSAVVVPEDPSTAAWVGLFAALGGGTTFGASPSFASAIGVEWRPAWLEHRLGLRAGLGYQRSARSGAVGFAGDTSLDGEVTVAHVAIPLELLFAFVRFEPFELLVRAGGALRFEAAALEVAAEKIGGESRVSFAGRAGLELGMSLGGPLDLYVGAGVDGVGADAGGLSAGGAAIEGTLMSFLAEAGARLWF